jgi:DNA replication and repair protein RecF
VFLPDRLGLIKGPPAGRRAHLDRFVAAQWPARGELRRRFAAALRQRNSLLSRIRAGHAAADSLDAWDSEFADVGMQLRTARAEAVATLEGPFADSAERLGLGAEATIAYRPRVESDGHEQFVAELQARREADLHRGHSGYGPQLDEIEIALRGRSLRRFGSQGEQRTGLLALLFAEREALVAAGRPGPLMLLDDVFSELDPERRRLLVERLATGQALITATEAGQLPAGTDARSIAVRAGAVVTAAAAA